MVAVLGFVSFGFSTFDYGWRCTKCLRDSHVIEHQFLGITYWRSSKLRFAGHDLTPITGSPCQHVFRKGGFGRSFGGLFGGGIGCGMTGEGGIFQWRWSSLSAAFELNEQFRNKDLLVETFRVVDTLLPPDATLSFYRTDKAELSLSKLAELSIALEKANSESEWSTALAAAQMMSGQGAAAIP